MTTTNGAVAPNMYIGVFDNYSIDEEGDELLGRFTLIVHALNVDAATDLFSQYMDERENDENEPIGGVVYESTIIEIKPGASIPTPLRFDSVLFDADSVMEGEIYVSHCPDQEQAGPLIETYTMHDPDEEDPEPFWESQDEEEGEGAQEDTEEDDDEDEDEEDEEGEQEQEESTDDPEPQAGGPDPKLN